MFSAEIRLGRLNTLRCIIVRQGFKILNFDFFFFFCINIGDALVTLRE